MNEPDLNELREVLDKYAYSDLRIPSYAFGRRVPLPVYQVSVDVTFSWDGATELPSGARATKRMYLDRFEALQDELESIGWIANERISVTFDSHMNGTTFTLGRELFRRGTEYGVECHASLDLLWFDRSETKERAA